MIIRKSFKFNNMHIVRNCSSDRCKYSTHSHTYKVEILLHGNTLDNGNMLYDFGLFKGYIKDAIKSFDNSVTLWNKDSDTYKSTMQKYSSRCITLDVSPSAEQFSVVIFKVVDAILKNTKFANGEGKIELDSVIVHETITGYASCNREFADSQVIDLEKIVFSDAIVNSWTNKNFWNDLVDGNKFVNPTPVRQVYE